MVGVRKEDSYGRRRPGSVGGMSAVYNSIIDHLEPREYHSNTLRRQCVENIVYIRCSRWLRTGRLAKIVRND